MMSSSDLPACPACGSRKVRAVHKYAGGGDGEILATFYACAQCGTDRTGAWNEIQPPPPPEKAFADLPAAFDQEAKDRHAEEDADLVDPRTLGIAATLPKGGDS